MSSASTPVSSRTVSRPTSRNCSASAPKRSNPVCGWCAVSTRRVSARSIWCRDADGNAVAIEIEDELNAVDQLTRYLERLRLTRASTGCRGMLVAETIKPRRIVLARDRGISCVTVDYEVLRSGRPRDLTLF